MQNLHRLAGDGQQHGGHGHIGRDRHRVEGVGDAEGKLAQIGQIPCAILRHAAGVADAHQKHPLGPGDEPGGFVQRGVVLRRAHPPQKVLQLVQGVGQMSLLVGARLLFELPFELRIAVAAHLFAEVQHRGGGNVGLGSQLADAHERHRVGALVDIAVDQQFQLVQALDLLCSEQFHETLLLLSGILWFYYNKRNCRKTGR